MNPVNRICNALGKADGMRFPFVKNPERWEFVTLSDDSFRATRIGKPQSEVFDLFEFQVPGNEIVECDRVRVCRQPWGLRGWVGAACEHMHREIASASRVPAGASREWGLPGAAISHWELPPAEEMRTSREGIRMAIRGHDGPVWSGVQLLLEEIGFPAVLELDLTGSGQFVRTEGSRVWPDVRWVVRQFETHKRWHRPTDLDFALVLALHNQVMVGRFATASVRFRHGMMIHRLREATTRPGSPRPEVCP